MQTDVQQLVAALPRTGIAHATRLGLALVPQMETDVWRDLVARLTNLARTATGARQTLTAWLGDALAYGERRYRGQIAACAEAAGLDAGTLRNAKMVCMRIPVSCRHDALSWTHHCEVGLAFAEPGEIERWLALAEAEKLSTAELRKRVRAYVAGQRGTVEVEAAAPSVAAFRLMRELRASGRMLGQQRDLWRRWPPSAAQLALQELEPLAEFIDALRARALEEAAPPPRDLNLN
jgi:hypothetical protein